VAGAAFLAWLAAFLAPAQAFMAPHWPAIAIGTQFANTLVWLVTALHFSPSLGRVIWGKFKVIEREDIHASWWCLCGAVMVGYMLRWLLAGHSSVLATPLLPMWCVCNLAMVGIGIGVVVTLRTRETVCHEGGVRKALMFWFATIVACIALTLALG
jgi:hypothetical protein